MNPRLLLVADTIDNQISPNSAELCGLADRLGADADRTMFLICGSDIIGPAEAFAARTGRPAVVVESTALRYPNPELMVDTIADLIARTDVDYICFLHTPAGCQAAAGTTIRTNAACLSGISDLRTAESGLIFQRSLFNGKLAMETRPHLQPVVMTVLPGAFSMDAPSGRVASKPSITVLTVDDAGSTYQPLSLTAADDTDAAIDRADIIIAAGRGIGSEENLEMVKRLARLLPNAAVAASRPLCDLKWLPYSRQVGATGKTVAPKLYLACGISGAQQHVQGMKDAQWIVAVNTDPNAAIFSVADYCVVEDVTVFLPLLTEIYENR